jgi:hypothetical protein
MVAAVAKLEPQTALKPAHHGGQRQAAADGAEEGVGGAEQVFRDAGSREHVAHQDEHRHHGQFVRKRCFGQRHGQQGTGDVEAVDEADAADGDGQQGDAQGDAQEGQQQHGGQANEADGHDADSSRCS